MRGCAGGMDRRGEDVGVGKRGVLGMAWLLRRVLGFRIGINRQNLRQGHISLDASSYGQSNSNLTPLVPCRRTSSKGTIQHVYCILIPFLRCTINGTLPYISPRYSGTGIISS